MKRITQSFAVLAVVLAALSACGGSTAARHELHDGAPLRPEPVRTVPGYTPPGTGLPEYMPMPEAPAYPRSPHTRPLPATNAPGVWAGDEPRAVRPIDDPDVARFYNVPLPLPDAAQEYDKKVATYCGSATALAARWASTAEWYGRLDINRKRCIAAALYSFCADNLATPTDKSNAARLAAVKGAAAKFKAEKCPPDPIVDPDVKGVLGPTIEYWLANDAHVRLPL